MQQSNQFALAFLVGQTQVLATRRNVGVRDAAVLCIYTRYVREDLEGRQVYQLQRILHFV